MALLLLRLLSLILLPTYLEFGTPLCSAHAGKVAARGAFLRNT